MSSRRPLRIAFIVSGDGQSGTYFRYHNLAKGLVRLGHRVVVYGQSASEHWRTRREERDGVEYVLAPSALGNAWIDYSINPGNVFSRLVQKVTRADVYHLFQPLENSALSWLTLRRLRSREGAVFAWDWDDLWCGGLFSTEPPHGTHPWRYRLLDRFERSLPRRADLVTTCSGYLARLAQRRGATHTVTVHNGYWPDEAPADRTTLRKSFGLNPDAFYLGFIGWTPTEVTWCLDALSRLDSTVRIASCGYDLRRNLDAYPSVADRVDYLGTLSAPEAKKLMRALDAGLLPLADRPLNESRLPIKFAEYLSAGCPVICGSVGEIRALGSSLRGVILLPPEKQGWIRGCVAAAHEIKKSPSCHLPDQRQLEALLAWPVLTERLECAYVTEIERRQTRSPASGVACGV